MNILFPEGTDSKIIIDLGSFLQSHEKQMLVGSEVKIVSDTEVEGYSRVRGGWNEGGAYTVYFYAQFDTPATEVGTWKGNKVYSGKLSQTDSNEKTGAYFKYNTTKGQKIRAKVGISFVGLNKARSNLSEMKSWDFPGSKRCGCRSVESASFKSPGYWNGRKQEDFLYGNVSQLLATCKQDRRKSEMGIR